MARKAIVPAALLLAAALCFAAGAGEKAKPAGSPFRAVELVLDGGKDGLAAWQVEVIYDPAKVVIVGLEGGTKAFDAAPDYEPFHDARGKTAGRIVLASFVTDDAKAPRGETVVARLHLRAGGEGAPELLVRTVTAAKPGGGKFKPEAQTRFIEQAQGD